MGKVTILDGIYTQCPAGWKSEEVVAVGTLRMIDRVMHYACYSNKQAHFVPFFPAEKVTIWEPVKRSHIIN